jgi:hypothetical protein
MSSSEMKEVDIHRVWSMKHIRQKQIHNKYLLKSVIHSKGPLEVHRSWDKLHEKIELREIVCEDAKQV